MVTDTDFVPHITAVISTFNPPADLVSRARRLFDQVNHVVVIDDGSSTSDMESMRKMLEEAGVEVVLLGENLGIAAALNAGIKSARAADPSTWILVLDQDSEVGTNYIAKALGAYRTAHQAGIKIGLIAPGRIAGRAVKTWTNSVGLTEPFDPIQSGCLIPPHSFGTVGDFDEALFIDAVDTDFNSRLRLAGLTLIPCADCELRHELGTSRPISIFGYRLRFRGRQLTAIDHAPLRVYYITRNMWTMVARYTKRDPKWMLRRFWMEVESNLVRLLLTRGRRTTIMAWFFGVTDALQGKSGRASTRTISRLAKHRH